MGSIVSVQINLGREEIISSSLIDEFRKKERGR